jgi:tRNA1Val (adenine37-N6)-methyltransferase
MTRSSKAEHWKKLGKQSSTFYFKQFRVEDGRSTMKVGTDAVMLATVAGVENARKIFEIGTGCGVMALILAQRSQALIDAIEIDEESVIQAGENAMNSPWKDRINVIHSSLQDYIHQAAEKYDLVISNPPFFSRSLKSPVTKRNISRHDDSLSFDDLIQGSTELMMPDASLWLILPVNESREFVKNAGDAGLFVHYELKIAHKKGDRYQRVILQLKTSRPEKIFEQALSIKDEDGSFTQEYIRLTKEFYLDF